LNETTSQWKTYEKRLFSEDLEIREVAPLPTRLMCKDKLEYGPEAQKVLKDLKATFIIASILVHPDFSMPFYMETVASLFA
jgi:hypothetical protein